MQAGGLLRRPGQLAAQVVAGTPPPFDSLAGSPQGTAQVDDLAAMSYAVAGLVEGVSYYRKEDSTTSKRADMIDRDRFYMKLREGERDGFNYANFNSFRE